MKATLKKHFWEWFKQHNESYLRWFSMGKAELQYWAQELVVHISMYGPIYVEILLPEAGTEPQIIISAGGDRKLFRTVEQLVAKAPAIPGWEVIGFYPPRPIDHGIEELWGHTGIDPHNLWCVPCLSDGDDHFDSGIYVFADCQKVPDEVFGRAVRVVVENLLGERSATLDIKWIVVERLMDREEDEPGQLIRLQELPAFLERTKYSSLHIDGQGRLEGE